MRYISIIVLLATLSSLTTGVFAQDVDESRMITEYSQVLTTLKDKALTEGISVIEIEKYLYSAMAVVYLGKCSVNDEYCPSVTNETNADLSKIAELGYIPFWPDNPITWEPMKVLGPGDDFSEGDLYFAVCSGDYRTTVNGISYANSFDLFVFGPQQALDSFGEFYQCSINREWSSPPAGALYGYSFYTTADRERAKMEERKRQREERLAAEKAEAEEQNAEEPNTDEATEK